MSDSKFNWQIRTAALSIFFLGFLGGALALNAYQAWFGGASSSGTKSQRFERIFDQLELTEAQKTDVQKIIGETREEIKTLRKERDQHVQQIRARSDERFKEIFNAEQWAKFQRLLDEFRQSEKNDNAVKHGNPGKR